MILTKNKLRVIHLPQVPCKGFSVEVGNEREAYLIEQTFANQHLFLFKNHFITDYSNIICIEMWDEDMDADEDGEKWCDYFNEGEDMEWDEFTGEYYNYVNGK